MGSECCKNVLHGVRHSRERRDKDFEDQQKPWPSEPSNVEGRWPGEFFRRAPASLDPARQQDVELSLICSRGSVAPLHPSFGSCLSVTAPPPRSEMPWAERGPSN